MNVREGLFSFGMMGISVLSAYVLFRKNPRESLVSRGPLFIVCFLGFFYFGFVELPLALPAVFEHLLGHSVFVDYMPPARMNVVQEGGTWWLVRWLDPIRAGYFYAIVVGTVWALFNLVQRRSWKLNALCVVVGILVWSVHVYLSVACSPLCL